MLIENGADIFAKNNENKTPRRVTNGNCILSKLLRNYEEESFKLNFFSVKNQENKIKNIHQKSINLINKNNNLNNIFDFNKFPEDYNAFDTLPNENNLEENENSNFRLFKNIRDNQFSNKILETIQTNEEEEQQQEEANLKLKAGDNDSAKAEEEISLTEEVSKENNLLQTHFRSEELKTLELKNHMIMLDLNNLENIFNEKSNKEQEQRFENKNENADNISNDNCLLLVSKNKQSFSQNNVKNFNIVSELNLNFNYKKAEIENNFIFKKKNLSIEIKHLENLDDAGAEEKKNIITEKSPNRNNNNIKSLDNTNNKIYFESEENFINTRNFINEYRYDDNNNKDYSKISLMKHNKQLSKILNYDENEFSKTLSPILGFRISNSNSIDFHKNQNLLLRDSNVTTSKIITMLDQNENIIKNLNSKNASETASSLNLVGNNTKKANLCKSPHNSILFNNASNNNIVNNNKIVIGNKSNLISNSNYQSHQTPINNSKIISKLETININDINAINVIKNNAKANENISSHRSKQSNFSKSKAGLIIKTELLEHKNDSYFTEANQKIKKRSFNNNNNYQSVSESIINNNQNLTVTQNISASNNNVTSFCEINKTLKYSGNYNISSSNKDKYSFLKTKTNLYYHKEIILDTENSLSERMESLMYVKLYSGIFKNSEVQNILKSLLESIDFEEDSNISFITEIAYLIFSFSFIELIPVLELAEKKLFFQKSLLGKLAQKEVGNIIKMFKAVENSLKKTILINWNLNNKNDNNYYYSNDFNYNGNENHLPILIDANNSIINLNTNLINFDTYNTNTSREEEIYRTEEGKVINNTNFINNNKNKNIKTHIDCNNKIKINNNKKLFEIRNISPKIVEIPNNHFSSKNDLNLMKSKIENLNNDEFSQLEDTLLSSKREFTCRNKFDEFFLMKNILSTNRSEAQNLNGNRNNLEAENPKIKLENEIEIDASNSKNSRNLNIKNQDDSETQVNNGVYNNVNTNQNSSKTIKYSVKNLVLRNKKTNEESNDDCPENVLDSLIRSDSNNSIGNSQNEEICAMKNSKEDNLVFSKFLIDPKKNFDENLNKIDYAKNIINKEIIISNELIDANATKKSPKLPSRITAIKPRIPSEPRKANSKSKNNSKTAKKGKDISLAKPQVDVKRNTINKFEISKSKADVINLNNSQSKINLNQDSTKNYKTENPIFNVANKHISNSNHQKNDFNDTSKITKINDNNNYKNTNNNPESAKLFKNKINRIFITNNKETSLGRNSKHLENLNSENSQDNTIKNLHENEYHLNNIRNINSLNNLQSISDHNAKININFNVNYNINYNFNSNNNLKKEIGSNYNINHVGISQSNDFERILFPSSTKSDSFNQNFFTYYNKRKLKNKYKESILNNNYNNYNNGKVGKVNSNIDSLYLSNLNNNEYETFLNNINADVNSNTKKRPKNVYFKSSNGKIQPVVLKDSIENSSTNKVLFTETIENKIEFNQDVEMNNSLIRNSEVFESKRNASLKSYLTGKIFEKK